MKVVLEPCLVCDGTGECKNHNEVYIDVDKTSVCENCHSPNAVCPICEGKGKIDALYASYLLDATDVLRD